MLKWRTPAAPRPTAWVLVTLALAAALLAACGEKDDSAGGAAAGQPATTMDHTKMSGMSGVPGHGTGGTVASDARHIQVSARSLAFLPNQLTAKTGESIAIVLDAQDAEHHFKIDEFNADIAAQKGKTGFGGFRAGAPGRYTFYCTMKGHREAGMEGVLVVEA